MKRKKSSASETWNKMHWCDNRLIVTQFDKEQVPFGKNSNASFTKFEHLVSNLQPFQGFFEKTVPYPSSLMRTLKRYNYTRKIKSAESMEQIRRVQSKYLNLANDWRIRNLGTPSDILGQDFQVIEEGDPFMVDFLTISTPPILGIKKTSQKFPNLLFNLRYSVYLDDYCGEVEYKNGALLKERRYESCDDNLIEELVGVEPAELDMEKDTDLM